MRKRRPIEIDGNALVRELRSSPARFQKAVNALRKKGVMDREIVRAMATATALVDPFGRSPAVPRPP